MLAPLVAQAEEADAQRVPLDGAIPPFVALAEDVGAADAEAALTLAIALRMRDHAGLAALADDPRAPRLPAAEVRARFGPLPGAAEAVAAWGEARGLGAATLSADGALLLFRTSAGAASEAFRVPLRLYDLGDVVVRSHVEAPLVPAALAPGIEAVIGLTDVPLRTSLVAHEAQAASAPPYGPAQLRAAYDVDALLAAGHDGAGRTVAITSWGAASQTALDEYAAEYGLPPVPLAHVTADGGAACPADADGLEWDMDVQLAHAMAPGAAIRVYCGAAPTVADMLAAISRVVSDDVADVVSQSWGTCDFFVDADTAAAYETKFLAAAVQGIAFFTASGDAGSRECTRAAMPSQAISPAWPATAPHTTSVGGTTLTLAEGAYGSETTWNTCAPCASGAWRASGGGPSLLYDKPAWQSAPPTATRRGSPDISAVADPATGVSVRSGGAWWQVGGTSAASPIAAGIWTDIVQRHGRMGNAAERLWPLLGNASALRDITSGHNGDFAAGAGYDYPTGLGTPRAAGILDALARPAAPVLVATGAADITLSWSVPFEGASPITGYRVYGGGSSASKELLAVVTGTTYVDEDVAPGIVRHYEVSAVNEHGEGQRSAERTARTYAAPQPPRGLATSTPVGAAVVRVTWSPPANANLAGVSGYELYRDGEHLETLLGPSATSYNDGLCPLARACTYHATARAVLGESAPSNAASGIGLSVGLASTGAPSSDPADSARLLGRERLVLQMDADDEGAPLAGFTRDSSPMQHHARVGSAQPAEGRFGGAYRLAGGAPLALAPDAATGALREGTLMMWVKVEREGALFSKPDALALVVEPDGALALTIEGERLATAPGAVERERWTHVAVTWGGGGRRLFVDGEHLAASAARGGVGASATSTIGGVEGVLDEVRVYDQALPSGLVRSVAHRPYAVFP